MEKIGRAEKKYGSFHEEAGGWRSADFAGGVMYRIIKVLNNNGVLAYDQDAGQEIIFLGKGAGFNRKMGERVSELKAPDGKRYELVKKGASLLSQVNSIDPVFIEASARIIQEAESMFGEIDKGILLPMADHIALAVNRARKGMELPNPFHQDIRALFEKEYQAALRGREILLEMTGSRISDDEVGYITLHIHSGLSRENVADSLNLARMVQEGVGQIEKGLGMSLEPDSLGYNRLLSHMRYLIARVRKGERVNLDLEDYARSNFPDAYAIAGQVCGFMEKELGLPIPQEEIGFLAIHIQRVRQPGA